MHSIVIYTSTVTKFDTILDFAHYKFTCSGVWIVLSANLQICLYFQPEIFMKSAGKRLNHFDTSAEYFPKTLSTKL